MGLLRRTLTYLRPAVCLAGVALLSQCAHHETLVAYKDQALVERKNETFGYRKWLAKDADPDVVIIALHGFDGASIDYENLGKDILKNQPKTALYAYEVRGQGSDPKRVRRGDIDDPADWYRDLDTFTGIIRKRHPHAKIVWMGESMGALITAHSWQQAPLDRKPCDALIFSSPVVKIRKDVPPWKVGLLNTAAEIAPTARLSLEQLSGGQDVQMTHTTKHTEQAETNAWHVEKNTLRLLSTLGRHIESMDACATTFRVPVLVLHGGKDFFTDEEAIRSFTGSIPKGTPVTTRIYPDAYHLLMYDTLKDEVIRDVEKWVDGLRK
ncbi:monoacylglycerol lipase [Luteolibacter sp. LG18]|nr:monoacylglycerol lipase [Luteolibacter sp. LG18]